jgi:hypothetical protein
LTPQIFNVKRDPSGKPIDKRHITYIDLINNDFISRFHTVELGEGEDLEEALKKIMKEVKKNVGKQPDPIEDEIEDEYIMEESEEESEIYNKVFTKEWQDSYKDSTEKAFVPFEELLEIKGCLIFRVVGDIYLVTPLSAPKELAKYDEELKNPAEYVSNPDTIIHTVHNIIYDYAQRAAEEMNQTLESNKDSGPLIDESCRQIFINGESVFDLCGEHVKKASCPILSRDYTCGISSIIINKMIHMVPNKRR